ncbi:ATP-binding protein [Nonomuraea sp. B1E8]|uniref:ATP-binding protein n=1 Tax=unclassified Nonomuraea TaxID=2593643 RepID=UPI00325EBF3D
MTPTGSRPHAPARPYVPRQREAGPPAALVRPEHVDATIGLHPGGLTWRRAFPGTPAQIPGARYFTRYLLAGSSHQDDAELIVAELATNALRHTSSGHTQGTFIVEIIQAVTATTLAVYDCGWGGSPRFTPCHRVDADHGRGLAIVAALADETGFEGDDTVGHRVWATIHVRSTP